MAGVIAAASDAYGVKVHEEVMRLAAGKRGVSLGAIYTTLGRLQDKGYVESWLGDYTGERGGRAKRMYRLKPTGRRVLVASLEPLARAIRIVGLA